MPGAFRVGVYIDGYNLYYGGNCLVGDGRWKWLDVRALVAAHIPTLAPWDRAVIDRVVYFTAEITNAPGSLRRQQASSRGSNAFKRMRIRCQMRNGSKLIQRTTYALHMRGMKRRGLM